MTASKQITVEGVRQQLLGTHTPGPWALGERDENDQRIVRSEHIEICTCWHHCVGNIERQMEANARLIAAAPDLLWALRDLLELAEALMRETDREPVPDGAIVQARAAIAKASA
jgi:hypothetical protein